MTASKEVILKNLSVVLVLLSGLSRADIPNAFNPSELGSAAVAALVDSCAGGVDKSGAEATPEYKYNYCSCITDWYSENPKELFRQALPTVPVIKKCSERALKKGKALFVVNEFNSKKQASIQVWNGMNFCQKQIKARFRAISLVEAYQDTDLYICSCYGDYWRNNTEKLGNVVPDEINHQCFVWFEKQAKIKKLPVIKSR